MACLKQERQHNYIVINIVYSYVTFNTLSSDGTLFEVSTTLQRTQDGVDEPCHYAQLLCHAENPCTRDRCITMFFNTPFILVPDNSSFSGDSKL